MDEKISVSAIIPTLGGASLESTIHHLNKGTLIPEEILVCLPQEVEFDESRIVKYGNVKMIRTKSFGQVAQRLDGLLMAKNSLVLQLDDDINLESNALKELHSSIIDLKAGNVVGPVYIDSLTSNNIHSLMGGWNGFTKNLFYFLFSGSKWGSRRMGTISASGVGFGVDPDLIFEKIKQVSWLPGGCVLSWKQDLITFNFYPNLGKAYFEDFINSYLRVENNCVHWVVINAKAITAQPLNDAFKTFLYSREIHEYFVILSNLSLIRLRIYEYITYIRIFFNRIKKL